jgi:mono/diheme cytochrome c family protein
MLAAGAALLAACGGSAATPAAQTPSPAAGPAVHAASAGVPASAGAGLPSGVTAAMVAEGDSIFNARRSCNRCHGLGGTNGRNGPDLTTGNYEHANGSFASILQVINEGVSRDQIKDKSHRFPMGPRGGLDLTDEQVKEVAAYVWTLGHH